MDTSRVALTLDEWNKLVPGDSILCAPCGCPHTVVKILKKKPEGNVLTINVGRPPKVEYVNEPFGTGYLSMKNPPKQLELF